MKRKKPLSVGGEWTFECIQAYDREIGRLARDFHLDTYPNQIEIISAEQMLDAYASVGMPMGYHHWSFGKRFVTLERRYKRGEMGLAYELVINSNPCISYLMEENTMAMQALVIAHACYGHNSFFKQNYLFRMWTNADAIIDELVFARQYITSCEEQYGIDAVESVLDACHALMNYGVDRYRHPARLSMEEEKVRQQHREAYRQSQMNELWRTIPVLEQEQQVTLSTHVPSEPQENILYFIEEHAPLLAPWQRDIIRIVRTMSQYFYPQKQTKVMNEGWACFWHHTLLNALYDEGCVTDEFMLEVLYHHSQVMTQLPFHHPHFHGINPYALGYGMMQDIKRMCEAPTPEDKIWFPHLVNTNWLSSLDSAMRNYKDESFIAQYLSPALMRSFKFFHWVDDDMRPHYDIHAIHNEDGYASIRTALSKTYHLSYIEPDIQVFSVDVEGDRTLTLHYTQQNRILLERSHAIAVLKHLYVLWRFPIVLKTFNEAGYCVDTIHFPEQTDLSSSVSAIHESSEKR